MSFPWQRSDFDSQMLRNDIKLQRWCESNNRYLIQEIFKLNALGHSKTKDSPIALVLNYPTPLFHAKWTNRMKERNTDLYRQWYNLNATVHISYRSLQIPLLHFNVAASKDNGSDTGSWLLFSRVHKFPPVMALHSVEQNDYMLIENHVITSVQVQSRAFDPILQAFCSCLQFPCRHVLPVWCECHVTTKVGCRPAEECACLCLCLAMDFLSQSRWPQLCHVETSPFLCIWLWRFSEQNFDYILVP